MAMKRKQYPVDEWVDLYQAGAPYSQVAAQYGVSVMTVYGRLKERGIGRSISETSAARFRSRREPFADAVADAYESGESSLSIARRFGITRQTVMVIIGERGITRRGGGDANKIRFLDPNQRGVGTRKAHLSMGRGERELADLLTERGFPPDRQVIVGHRNIDLAIDHLAIEVAGYTTSPLRPCSREHERSVDLFDAGFSIIYVWMCSRSEIIGAAADDVIAFYQATRSDPPARRQYRVIRGCGKFAAAGRDKLDEVSFKRSLHRCAKPAA